MWFIIILLLSTSTHGQFIDAHSSIRALESDGSSIFLGIGETNQLYQFNAKNGHFIKSFPASHTGFITKIRASKDFVYTASADYFIKKWDVKTGKRLATYAGHKNAICAMALSADGKFIYSASTPDPYDPLLHPTQKDDYIAIRDAKIGRVIRKLSGVGGYVFDLIVSPTDKTRLYSISTDIHGRLDVLGSTRVIEWDIINGIKLKTFEFKKAEIARSSVERDSTYIMGNHLYMLMSAMDGTTPIDNLVKFDLVSFKPVKSYSKFPIGMIGITLDRSGIYALSGISEILKFDFNLNRQASPIRQGNVNSIHVFNKNGLLWANSQNTLKSYRLN